MEFNIWMYVTVYIAQLIGAFLALAIFSSVFIESRKRGYLYLASICVGMINALILGFSASTVMGIGMLIINVCLLVVAYFDTKKKMNKFLYRD
ncbi:hypothetical protein MUN88_00940 [Gracilibacillus caseinilyticus]|uniref:Inner membrane protein n=1 Tax=Gracilibacillus caseinilyticus TaxID=2932256 RepID=A0ABY4EWG0_9BACI|nr:hypothetical protein [Gracilibacillus caseinilyticus]UOQ48758.1 hypothetical protein MUN88_00940 [Gracilibacillus caseinilyticus]